MTTDTNLKLSINSTGIKPVGFLTELSDIEAISISLLRAWCDGDEQQFEITSRLIFLLGKEKGLETSSDLIKLCNILFFRNQKTFMRHHSDCYCIGAHEAYFANIILTLANEDIEGAEILVQLFFDHELVIDFLEIAKRFGTRIKALNKGNLRARSPLQLCAQIH